jgi:hypothetical protein
MSSTDPLYHRQLEEQMMRHVDRLLGDERLRIDTTLGRRPVPSFILKPERSDHAVDLKRLMSEMNVPDRELHAKMPQGLTLDVALSRKRMIFFTQTVGRLRVVCVSPTRALIAGEEPKPLNTSELQKVLSAFSPPTPGAPTTVLVVSTGGFTLEAHEAAERRTDRTVVLAEPNDAGGWTVTGPSETKALTDLFDPEADDEKQSRVRGEIEEGKGNLSAAGIASDKLAAKLQLPVQFVEGELKSYARANAGLVARRLDGRVVLFREGSAPPPSVATGGSPMPLIDRVKTLFARKGEVEKKIAFLSERRTALSQQRERSYEEMATLEAQEAQMKRQFGEATGTITKKRVTSQLLQLRKDLERRQQLLSVLNQQVDVVSTHLHNLELVQQGQSAKLPDAEEMTADAVKAEEMLAELEAESELAATIGQTGGIAGLNAEEQALYEELERETGTAKAAAPAATASAAKPAQKQDQPARSQSAAAPTPQRRGEAEPG